jgi:hypothetical protein
MDSEPDESEPAAVKAVLDQIGVELAELEVETAGIVELSSKLRGMLFLLMPGLVAVAFALGWLLRASADDQYVSPWPAVVGVVIGVSCCLLGLLRANTRLWRSNLESFRSNLHVIGFGILLSVGFYFLGRAS